MKALIALALTSFTVGHLFAQGVVTFDNRPFSGDAPVTLADGTAPGASMVGGLYLVRNGALELLATTPFRTGEPPREKFLQGFDITVPGIPPGQPATFRVRVWAAKFASYEAAFAAGACSAEFPTSSGDGTIHVPKLGDPNPIGGHPTEIPTLDGLLPLEVPCDRSSTDASMLVPIVKLNTQPPFSIGGHLHINFLTGFPQKQTIIQSSTNLTDWMNIATNVPLSNNFSFDAPATSTDSNRWFRALIPSP